MGSSDTRRGRVETNVSAYKVFTRTIDMGWKFEPVAAVVLVPKMVT